METTKCALVNCCLPAIRSMSLWRVRLKKNDNLKKQTLKIVKGPKAPPDLIDCRKIYFVHLNLMFENGVGLIGTHAIFRTRSNNFFQEA